MRPPHSVVLSMAGWFLLVSVGACGGLAQEPSGQGELEPIFRLPVTAAAGSDEERSSRVVRAAISADGSWLATRNGRWEIAIWNTRRREQVATLPVANERLDPMFFSRDGQVLVTAAPMTGERVSLWDVPSGRPRLHMAHPVDVVRLLADGRLAVLGSSRRITYLLPSGKQSESRPLRDLRHAQPLVMSSNGSMIVTHAASLGGASGNSLIGYDIEEDRVFPMGTVPSEPLAAVLAEDHSWLAMVLRDESVILLRSSTDFNTVTFLVGHRHPVTAIAGSPDGQFLFSGDQGGGIRVWDVMDEAILFEIPAATEASSDSDKPAERDADENRHRAITQLAVSDDGRYWLATSQVSGTENVRLWTLRDLLRAASLAASSSSSSSATTPEEIWRGLATESSWGAVEWLLEDPARALNLLREKVADSTESVRREDIDQWLDQLDDEEYAVRARAYEELRTRRQRILPLLEAALGERRSLESRLALRRLLDGKSDDETVPPAELRRWRRVIMVLECLDPPTVPLLERLRDGHVDPRVRAAAERALARLALRRGAVGSGGSLKLN